ncbi:hypothetical protein AB0M33_04560 [Micrococcus luteus]|uniref:hypothetical protein n=1 Tax=Micrococcus luteus TaxID=1270 RepID=UPI003324650F
MSNLIHAATTVAAGVPNIAPSFNGPWMPTIQNITGLALGTFLVILIVAVGIGVLVWIFGKLSSNGRAQDVGISFVLWGVLAAALIAGAASLIGWGAGLPLF